MVYKQHIAAQCAINPLTERQASDTLVPMRNPDFRIAAVAATVLGWGLAPDALASRARNLTMGTADPLATLSFGSHGSLFHDGKYNMFYNPSYSNDFKNWVAIEKTNGLAGLDSAEGGFVTSFMNYNFGMYFNRGDAVMTGAGANSYANGVNFRPIDVIVSGDIGVEWGFGLTYGAAHASSATTASDLTLRLGAQMSGLEPFASVKLVGSDRVAGTETRYATYGAGLRYRWGEWAPYLNWRHDRSAPARDHILGVGLARNTKFDESVRLNYAFGLWRGTAARRTLIPVHIGVEGDLNSWITARAGLSYNVYDRASNVTVADTTAGALGATLHVGKIDFDWAVGHVGSGEDVNDGAFALDSGFFSAASLAYSW